MGVHHTRREPNEIELTAAHELCLLLLPRPLLGPQPRLHPRPRTCTGLACPGLGPRPRADGCGCGCVLRARFAVRTRECGSAGVWVCGQPLRAVPSACSGCTRRGPWATQGFVGPAHAASRLPFPGWRVRCMALPAACGRAATATATATCACTPRQHTRRHRCTCRTHACRHPTTAMHTTLAGMHAACVPCCPRLPTNAKPHDLFRLSVSECSRQVLPSRTHPVIQ